jgi:acyl-CoA thioesterase
MQSRSNSSFEAALALTPCAGGHSAHIPDTWSQGRATYGGLVGGLLARAGATQVPPERSLRSALIDFVGPAAPGAATLSARVLRSGRTLTHVEVHLVQANEIVATLTGAYGGARNTSLSVPGAGAPAVPSAEQLPRLPYIENAMPRFTQHFEYRVLPGRQLFSAAARAEMGGYVRHPQGGPVDAAGLLGLIDSWPPPFMPTLRRPAVSSTVTWMVDFFAELPPQGVESAAYYRYEAELVAAHAGYASCDARLWDEQGRLLAASRQLNAEFSQPDG